MLERKREKGTSRCPPNSLAPVSCLQPMGGCATLVEEQQEIPKHCNPSFRLLIFSGNAFSWEKNTKASRYIGVSMKPFYDILH
jgi:hypothetical protein